MLEIPMRTTTSTPSRPVRPEPGGSTPLPDVVLATTDRAEEAPARSPRWFGRVAATVLLAIGLVAVPAVQTVVPAQAESAPRLTARVMSHSQNVVRDQVNRTRTARSRRALPTNGLMNQKAQRWAEHLRNCQCLAHRAAPFGTPPGWCAAAENVGRSGDGNTLGAVHNAFMHSTGHRDNILNTRWTDVGIGVARDRRGEYFVVHAFADFSC
jgi:uncharacterized protein YkwD